MNIKNIKKQKYISFDKESLNESSIINENNEDLNDFIEYIKQNIEEDKNLVI